MSYSIVYKRQFLRVGVKIIPLNLVGSNNLWEADNKRRVRDWNPMMNSVNDIPLLTVGEVMKTADTWTGGTYQEHFKYQSKWVDDASLIRFCKNGIKNARTIEELKALSAYPEDVYLKCRLNIWYTDGSTYADGSLCQKNKSELIRETHSSDGVLEFLSLAKNRITNKKENEVDIYVWIGFSNENVVAWPKESIKRKKAERPSSDYWVVFAHRKSGVSAYVEKLTKKHLYFARTADTAKAFTSKKKAEYWIKERNIVERFENIESFDVQYVA